MEHSFALAELHSADPTERQLAQQALRVLQSAAFTPGQKRDKISAIQQALQAHRRQARQAQRQAELISRVQKLVQSLPEKRLPPCVQIDEGRLKTGELKTLPTGGSVFCWRDWGPLPPHTTEHDVRHALSRLKKGKPAQRDPLATRRHELRRA